MFDDFEDPFALPMEELKLAAPPEPTATKKHAPAYRQNEVVALAAFGEVGGLAKNGSYALRTRRRKAVLHAALLEHRRKLAAALTLRDKELEALTSTLADKGIGGSAATDPDPHKHTLALLHSGEVGVVLALPVLDAFSKAREVSRQAALHAAALNVVDDGAYRRGSEGLALVASIVAMAFALLLLF
ncbi:MAG: hypothetical protein AB8H86_17975 [Polyangiales bacterium]